MGDILVGTASWTDRSLVKSGWYPSDGPLLELYRCIADLGMYALFHTGIFLNGHFGYDQSQVGWFFGFIGIIILIVQGGILRRVAKGSYDWSLASMGPLLVAIGMGIYCVTAFHRSLGVLLIAGALNAVGRSFQGPTLSSLLARYSDRREQGVTFGLYNGLSSLARVIGPIIAGAAYPLLRNAGPFATAGVIALAGALWTVGLQSRAAEVEAT